MPTVVNGPPFTERSNRDDVVACSGVATARTSTMPRTRWPGLGASSAITGGGIVAVVTALVRVCPALSSTIAL